MPDELSPILFDIFNAGIHDAVSKSELTTLEKLRTELRNFKGQRAKILLKEVNSEMHTLRERRNAPQVLPVVENAAHQPEREETRKNPSITPTDEQKYALELFGRQGSLTINAFAGTGKTSTLIQIARSTKMSGVYLAFNRAIANEAEQRFPQNVTCSTIHAMAYRSVFPKYGENSKLIDSLNPPRLAEILGLEPMQFEDSILLEPRSRAFLALKTLNRFFYSGDDQIRGGHVPMLGAVASASRETQAAVRESTLHLAAETWELMRSATSPVPLGHDGYLKLWALGRPQIKADFVMLDEAQDSNAVILEILARGLAKIVLVGDRYQQIYEWRHAVDAMERILTAHRCSLTRTFRFGSEIAKLANSVLSRLGATEDLVGDVTRKSEVGPVVPDAVIARTNAGAFSAIVEARSKNSRPCLIGGAGPLLDMVRGVFALKEGRPSTVAEFYGFPDWDSVIAHSEKDEGKDLAAFVGLVQRWTPEFLFAALQNLPNENRADLIVSTAHKAKGREWGKVRLSPDFMSAALDTDVGRQLPPEQLRLLYVAITRARDAVEVPNGIFALLSGDR